MLKSRKIAITGGIATGKSTVCDFLEELGCYVIRADVIVHKFLQPATSVGKQIIELLGEQIMEDGRLSRQKIAQLVFKDKNMLKALEKIIHPVVLKEIEEKTSQVEGHYTCIVVEIPLLYEIEQEVFFDYVIAVISDKSKCLKRLESKGFSKDEYEKRMKFQIDPEDKRKKADYLIENNGSLDSLKEQVIKLYKNLLAA